MTAKTSTGARRPDESAPTLLGRLFDAHEAIGRSLMSWVEPLFNVLARCVVAWDFFRSGLTRVDGWKFFASLNIPAEHWQKQIDLFANIHPLPLMPPAFAAFAAAAAEIILPILLVGGLFTRAPALGLLVMAGMIEFIAARTPQGIENGIANHQHILWMLLFGYFVIRGGGPFSIDGFVKSQRE